jgi:RNA polymerase sigma-70 factor (ECF subfamily)
VNGVENESDAALIARAKEDPEAFGILYQRYVSQIYRYLYYRTGNHEDAEDLTARTFYRALRRFPHYVDRGAPFTAWLYRIAHNVVVNWMRDRQRRPTVPLESVTVSSEEERDPHAVAEAREETEKLLRAVRRLAPDRQQLLILKFVEGMSNAEIAEVMGRTEGAIKALYHRTLVSLREELAREAGSGKQGTRNKGQETESGKQGS